MTTNNSPFFIDTNIPMYAVGKDHPLRAYCQQIMTHIGYETVNAITDVEVHQEILHRYLSLDLPEQARQVSRYFQAIVPDVLPVTLDDVMRARELSVEYPVLDARDLLHVAVMLNNGITHMLSADVHFDHVAEITRIAPAQFATG